MKQDVSNSASFSADFSLFGGGPLFQLQQQLRLVREGQRRQGLAAFSTILVAWVPLAILTAAEGLALGSTHFGSFLLDFEVNVRLLIGVPALVLAETLCTDQLRTVIQQFRRAEVIATEDESSFHRLLDDTLHLAHSARAEAMLVGLAYLHSALVFWYILDFPEATWRLPVRDGRHVLSFSGGWYFLVSFPLYSLVLLRWLWRIALWWRLLWNISKFELRLSAAHRDGAGGLGFLSESLSAFTGFAFGATVVTAGGLADLIIYEGHSPLLYKWQVIGLMALMVLVIAGPLVFFMRRLYETKETALFQYGALASRHTRQVERKWLSADPMDQELGIDFRAVAHLGSSVAAVRNMSILPVYKDDVLKLLLVSLLPFVPLLATLIPMDEVLSLLLKVIV